MAPTPAGVRLRLFLESRLDCDNGWVRDFASRLGVSRQAVHAWLNGSAEPSMATLRDMARVLGCRRSEIVAALDGDGPD